MRRRFVHQPSSKTTCFSAGGSRSRFPSAGTLASWPTLMLERLRRLNVSRLGMLEIYTETMDSSQITGELTKVSKVGTLGGRLWSFGEKVLPQEVVHLVKNDWLIPEWYVSFILMFSSELHLYTKLCTRKLQILILIRHCKILIIDIYIYL